MFAILEYSKQARCDKELDGTTLLTISIAIDARNDAGSKYLE
jgi:hypothetical protein